VPAYLEDRDQEFIQLILVDVVTLWTVKRPSKAQAIDSDLSTNMFWHTHVIGNSRMQECYFSDDL